MCMSKIFTVRGGERTLVVEEASSVEVLGDSVKIATLFGEETVLEGWSVFEIDLMKNAILLKPKQGQEEED